jgi:DNA modification methylase
MAWQLYQGDALETLKQMEDESINCCVTSPPYWGLRDYGAEGQLGVEPTPEEYVAKMVEVFREVKRVLRDDATLWLNMGDCYNSPNTHSGKVDKVNWGLQRVLDAKANNPGTTNTLKPKDLIGQPWRVAFALQADGWYLRSDIIWSKPNPMPESVTDRPTKAHEYIFLLSKSSRYFYDAEAIKETAVNEGKIVQCGPNSRADVDRVPRETLKQDLIGKRQYTGFNERWANNPCNGRNKRTVWTIATQPFSECHFATFPPKLIEPCILAGCPEGGTVLDPFAGAGTTLYVAEKLWRNSVGIELNPDYCKIIERRMAGIEPNLFEGVKRC